MCLNEISLDDIQYHSDLLQLDEGFFFGIGFFETILVKDEAVFLEAHVERINKSLSTFDIKRRLTPECVNAFISQYEIRDCALKLVITEKNVFASTRPIAYTDALYQVGFHVFVGDFVRASKMRLIHHKSLNYGECILAHRWARQNGYNDCLFQNEHGNLTETSIANLFIVENGLLVTPPLSEGLLPGVVRAELMKLYPVVESPITMDRLMTSEGAFLTNSLMGIMKISKVNGRAISDSTFVYQIREYYKYHLEHGGRNKGSNQLEVRTPNVK